MEFDEFIRELGSRGVTALVLKEAEVSIEPAVEMPAERAGDDLAEALSAEIVGMELQQAGYFLLRAPDYPAEVVALWIVGVTGDEVPHLRQYLCSVIPTLGRVGRAELSRETQCTFDEVLELVSSRLARGYTTEAVPATTPLALPIALRV